MSCDIDIDVKGATMTKERSRLERACGAMLCSIPLLAGCRAQDGTQAPSPASATSPATHPAPAVSPSGATTAPPPTTAAEAPAPPGRWGFDEDAVDRAPSGFSFARTGTGKEGRWVVRAASDAPSKRNVLLQADDDPTDNRFPVAVVEGTSFEDVRVSVSCKPVSGRVDQACGLVWRFADVNNYYLVRANALEDNVRLYHVKDGNRRQFASWTGKVAKNVWHRISVEAKGDRFVVTFDDKPILDARDSAFSGLGKVGVWTKADSVTQFDDLSATAP
jgi:hypothetical protein